MAKCIGSVEEWRPNVKEDEEADFDVDNVREGESLLKLKLDKRIEPLLLSTASNYIKIKQSALTDQFQIDCSLVQETIVNQLELLQSRILSVIQCISKSSAIRSTKHRYYILFSYGIIEKIQQLLQTVGRLSEIDQKLYNEEHRKLLISDESITIHSLTLIWTAVISMIDLFCQHANSIFNTEEEPQEYDFIGQLEFFTTHLHHSKILLMDLTITSWIKFNRLVKFDDLVEALPFLCPCHCKIYFKILKGASKDDKKPLNIIRELLPLILDHQSRPSMLTLSARRFGVVPLEPCYVGFDVNELAYFIIWHLYSISRIVSNEQRHLIGDCKQVLESCFDLAIKIFLPRESQQQLQKGSGDQVHRLSPHQQERFKLMLLMLSSWCEKNKDHFSTLTRMFSFFLKYWDLFCGHYFDMADFTINGSTIFHLFTKLYTDAIPTYTTDGQAVAETKKEPTKDEKDLMMTWNEILSKIQIVKNPQQSSSGSSKTVN